MTFHYLHHGDQPFLLPNAWDHASAAALVAAGFPAVGTTSLGVAAAAGLPDGEGVTRDETVRLAKGLCALPCFVTADIEGGFSDDPAEVADLVAELAEAGVAGINIEDGRSDGSLVPAEHHARKIRAIADTGIFVNARTDVFWLNTAGPEEAISRCRTYVDAGADGVFVPGVSDAHVISAIVAKIDAPVNVLLSTIAYPDLAELGVSRVSTGSLLFRVALDATVKTAIAAATEQPPVPGFSYSDIQAVTQR